MENIYYLLFAFLFVWYFLYLRKIAEAGKRHINQYCQDSDIQLVDLSSRSSRLTFSKKYGIHWLTTFDFEFSGDGQSRYRGEFTLRNLKLENIVVPPYRVK